MIPKPFRFSLFSLVLLHSIGCAPGTSTAHKAGAQEQIKAAESDSVDYTDEIGRYVRLPKHPLRIVSLAPSVTEVLYLLGAQDRLVGVTTHCDWPEDAKTKPKIGNLLNPNYEVILAAKPDLVIATTAGNDRAAVLKLAGLGLPVFVTAPRSVEKIFETVLDAGRITDRAREAEQLVSNMRERLDEVRRRLAGLPPTRAFFMTWFDPLLAPGKNTFENDVLRQAGVESITADIEEFYPRYSLEQILARDPEAILTVEHNTRSVADLKRIAGWNRLSAVRKGRVYVLSEVIQHPSPRFVEGVEELARKLHPERFQ
ncbi:MAG: cobalamin-binding protein [Acidobacteria bacterium]|nr:MAG: cobalamin-binding protein [Acidobacteriota bacterium]